MCLVSRVVLADLPQLGEKSNKKKQNKNNKNQQQNKTNKTNKHLGEAKKGENNSWDPWLTAGPWPRPQGPSSMIRLVARPRPMVRPMALAPSSGPCPMVSLERVPGVFFAFFRLVWMYVLPFSIDFHSLFCFFCFFRLSGCWRRVPC